MEELPPGSNIANIAGLTKLNTKASVAERMDEIRALGIECDPLQILMEIASGTKLMQDKTVVKMTPYPDPKVRQKAAEALCSYLYAKRKAVEVTGNQQKPIAFAVVQDLVEPPAIPEAHAPQITATTKQQPRREVNMLIIEGEVESPKA